MSSPSRSWTPSGNYSPPKPAPALDREFLFSSLSQTLQEDLNNSSIPLLVELDEKEEELLADISSYLNSKISEYAAFAMNLIELNGNESKSNDNLEDKETIVADSPQKGNGSAVPATDTSRSNTLEIDTLETVSTSSQQGDTNSPVILPLKSSMAKPKINRKNSAHTNKTPDDLDNPKKKKVMFSNNDQIAIVPSLEDLEQHFASQEDSESEEEEEKVTVEPVPEPSEPLDFSNETSYSDFEDDDFNSTVAMVHQFTSPLYSDSTYSSGLDSIECSPVQAGLLDQGIPSSASNISDDQPLNEFSYPKPSTHFHSEATKSDNVDDLETSIPKEVEESIKGSSPTEETRLPKNPSPTVQEVKPPSYSTIPEPLPDVSQVEKESDSSSDESQSQPAFTDYDEDDDVFQFDETLGVMPDTSNPPATVDSLSFPSSRFSRNQFSNSRALATDFSQQLPDIAASLPSNQSRTSQSQLPTVVGSLRPRPMSKYKLDGAFTTNNKLPTITGSGNNSLASSLSSSNATITPTDRQHSYFGRSIGYQQRSNGFASTNTNNNDNHGSNFASSLPIQIGSNTWGHLARQQPQKLTHTDITDTNRPMSFLDDSNQSVQDNSGAGKSGRMLPYGDQDTFVGSSSGPQGLTLDDTTIDEELLMYASPASAAQIMYPESLEPDQMSFSQRLVWERRSSTRH